MLRNLVVMTTLGITSLASVHADVHWARCPEMGESLDANQATERWEWVKKCDPIGFRYSKNSMYASNNGEKRITYPIYGIDNPSGGAPTYTEYKAPANRNAPCNIPDTHMIVSFCAAGCYTPSQKVSLFDEEMDVTLDADLIGKTLDEAHHQQKALVWNGNGFNPSYQLSELNSVIPSLEKSEETILVLETKSGGSIEVTENHPLVDGKGLLQAAVNLKVGDSLVTHEGEKDEIVSIKKTKFFGKVWNIEVGEKSPFKRIVVAQGFLNGDISFQNEKQNYLNQLVLRQNIPSNLIEK